MNSELVERQPRRQSKINRIRLKYLLCFNNVVGCVGAKSWFMQGIRSGNELDQIGGMRKFSLVSPNHHKLMTCMNSDPSCMFHTCKVHWWYQSNHQRTRAHFNATAPR